MKDDYEMELKEILFLIPDMNPYVMQRSGYILCITVQIEGMN